MATMRQRKRRVQHSRIARLNAKCLRRFRLDPNAVAKILAAIFGPAAQAGGKQA